MSSVTRAPTSSTMPKLSWPSTRKGLPSGASPYSAALISLSVPSTPTRSTRTSTPRPPGMSLTAGFGSSARCTDPGWPGKTAIAFIIRGPRGSVDGCAARVEARVLAMADISAREWGKRRSGSHDLDDMAVGIAHEEAPVEAEGAILHPHDAGRHELRPRRGQPSCESCQVRARDERLPVDEVVRPLVGWGGAAVVRAQVLEELDAGPPPPRRAQAGDPESRAGHVVEPLLLGAV